MNANRHDIQEQYGEELELFTLWMKNQGMTPATQRAYLSDTSHYLRSIFPASLRATGKVDIMRFLSQARERGAGDEARNRKLSSLRTFYKALNEVEHLHINPAQATAKSKQQKNKLPVYLDAQHLQTFFESVEGKYRYRNMTILLLMAYAGLRVGEIHRMNVQDLNQDGSVHILGKGRKWRSIPLPPVLQDIVRKAAQERIIPRQSKEQALFVSQFGRRLSVRMIQSIADETFTRLKSKDSTLTAKKLSSHKLRHSFATMQIRGGTDIRTLQELLGHASIETTQIYTHVDNKQMIAAMNHYAEQIPNPLH